ncbi:DUF1543 domain-containing protein [Mucilaginibacter celer]|uniref:DUF1543 domain-containing protein n=1 Tax=Mucilaginibacter celer TaxID=2305508 RepID=A0A494VUA0_9SPHI|nr:DUF1543 domain-containing protein [Mucilaginibacter celer]AYL94905.1 DUF1543 domain-containing protein [Mucilaginibacter celer]
MENLKLFMLLLGCKPSGRHTEQHDVFFGIAASLRDLIPEIQAFGPEPERIHIDAWREVNTVDGYKVEIKPRDNSIGQHSKLFFINLGGYQPDKFEEQHYAVLTVQNDFASASKNAKETYFFKHNHFNGANSHIDDKYGIDVDDIYNVEDILSATQKAEYQIVLIPNTGLPEDKINLGYFKLSSL